MMKFKDSRIPKLAMVMIVRNEARFLRAHLAYHHMAGIDRCYLFLHDCTDDSEQIAREFSWVKIVRLSGSLPESLNYISEIHRLAMDRALGWARDDGVDWLLIIDADEFACALSFGDRKPDDPCHEHDLHSLFDAIDEEVIQVKLTTKELLPQQLLMQDPFYENNVFIRSEKFQRTIRDAKGAERVIWKGFLGHAQGQSFVRVNAPVRAYDSHRWTIMQELPIGKRPVYIPLPSVERGWHAHFYLASTNHWMEKFTKHNRFPMHWPGENPITLETPVRMWREAARLFGFNVSHVEAYCRESVFISDNVIDTELSKGTLSRGPVLGELIKQALAEAQEKSSMKCPPSKIETVSFSELVYSPVEVNDSKDLDWSPVLLEDAKLSGFYDREERDGTWFRWAQPKAEIQGAIPAGQYILKMKVLDGFQTMINFKKLSVSINHEALRFEIKRNELRTSSFHLNGGSPTVLKLESLRLELDSGDSRIFGIPWTRVVLQRLESKGFLYGK